MSRHPLHSRPRRPRVSHLSHEAESCAAALWPTPGQELLLRAALLRGPEALDAWNEWKARHDLIETNLDHGSFRLLPLVYKNLRALSADEPLMPRLKGIYRYWWCSNQRLLYRSAGVVQGLADAGIPTMLLKGSAASTLFYKDAGARPMADIDVLVPVAHASSAVAQLSRLGWKPARPRVADLIRYQHSVRMVNSTGEALDLHWHVLAECVRWDADDGFWERSLVVRIMQARTRALAPTDALLHTVVHGMRWNEEPTVRWIADAMTILHATKGAIDWGGLRDEARSQRVLIRLTSGLAYLRRALGAPIPESALQLLRETAPAGIERMEYRVLALGSRGRKRPQLGHGQLLLVQYLRFVSGMSLSRTIAETPAYVRYRLRGRSGLVFDAVRGIRRGIRRLLGPKVATRGAA
jgi:putative nucleotidyltransferase-like protein